MLMLIGGFFFFDLLAHIFDYLAHFPLISLFFRDKTLCTVLQVGIKYGSCLSSYYCLWAECFFCFFLSPFLFSCDVIEARG